MLKDVLLVREGDIDRLSEDLLNALDILSLNYLEQRRKIVENIKKDKVNDFLVAMFDVGASIRQTLKALQLFGIPSEQYWPYDVNTLDFNDEPPQFCYAFAQNYQTLKYFRLDSIDLSEGNDAEGQDNKTLILTQIKAVLAAGFPAVCGFLYEFGNNDESGNILLPSEKIITAFNDFKASQSQKADNEQGTKIFGHAVLVVGYSDIKQAFLFQNSYGKDWGDAGYGWLPYEFIRQGWAADWWSLLNSEWVEVGDFGLDSSWGGGQKKDPVKGARTR